MLGEVEKRLEELAADLDAERAVIGAILVSETAVAAVAERLSPEDFYSEVHRIIYGAMMRLYARGEPIDQLTLTNELRSVGDFEKAGGRAYVFQIVESVPTAANAARYAEIVRGKALLRMGESSDSSPSEAALHTARTRNAVRVLTDRARLRKECVRASVVEAALGVSRQRLHRMREEGRLVAVLVRDRSPALYPYWQFSEEGDVVDGLERLVRASREAGMGPETLHFFMTEPNERLDGERPADLLRRGEIDRVVDVLHSSGLGPF